MALNDPHLLVFMTLSHLLSSRAGWLPCLTKRILQKWWMIRWPWKTVTSVSGPQLAFPVFSQGCQPPYCEPSKGEAYVATSVAGNQREPDACQASHVSEVGSGSFPSGALKWRQPPLMSRLQPRERHWARRHPGWPCLGSLSKETGI